MDTIHPRGAIRNKAFTQCNDFTGLLYGKITPTDIDGMVEFGDKVFIFIEMKYDDGVMPYGQRLAIERTVDAIAESGRVSTCLVASHHTDPQFDIDAANAQVVEYRHGGAWITPRAPITVREAIDELLAKYAPNYL